MSLIGLFLAQNVFVSSKGDNWTVKIGDFGLSKCIGNSTGARTRVGTLLYQAPEILGWIDEDFDDYTHVVDIWSLGCLAYALLAHGPMCEKEIRHYRKGMRRLPTEALKKNKVSDSAVKFIEDLLVPEPEDRLSAHMALHSSWLRRANPGGHRELLVFDSPDDHRALQALYVAGFGCGGKSLSGPDALYWSMANEYDFVTIFLFRNGVGIDVIDSLSTQHTPFHLAARDGDWTVMRRMLDLGANLNAANRRGYRAIHIAAQKCHEHVVTNLIRKMDVDPNDQSFHEKMTALHCAAAAGHITIVNDLLSNGAFVDAKCASKTTPLHCASLDGHCHVARVLIQKGAYVDHQDIMGMSPLRYAVNHDQQGMVELLLENGADIHLKDSAGVSPLTRAKDLGDRRIKQLLLGDRWIKQLFLGKKSQLQKEVKNKVKRQKEIERKRQQTMSRKMERTLKAKQGLNRLGLGQQKSDLKDMPTSRQEIAQWQAQQKSDLESETAEPTLFFLSDEKGTDPAMASQGLARQLRGQADLRRFPVPWRPDWRAFLEFLHLKESRDKKLKQSFPAASVLQDQDQPPFLYGYRTGGFLDLMMPRPTIIASGHVKENIMDTDSVLEEPRLWQQRAVGKLADDLDSHGLRRRGKRAGTI